MEEIRAHVGNDAEKAIEALIVVRDWISEELPIPTPKATAMLVRISRAIQVLAPTGGRMDE